MAQGRKIHLNHKAEQILNKIRSPGQSYSGTIIELANKADIQHTNQ